MELREAKSSYENFQRVLGFNDLTVVVHRVEAIIDLIGPALSTRILVAILNSNLLLLPSEKYMGYKILSLRGCKAILE